MTRVETLLREFREEIEGRQISAVVCASAEFSRCAARTAAQFFCINLDFRLHPKIANCPDILFIKMGARRVFIRAV